MPLQIDTIEKAEQGVRDLVQDVRNIQSEPVKKIRHAFDIAFEIALIVGFIYVVLWVCTHLMPW